VAVVRDTPSDLKFASHFANFREIEWDFGPISKFDEEDGEIPDDWRPLSGPPNVTNEHI